MTNPTIAAATLKQIKELAAVGCDVIRCAVPDMPAAQALREIVAQSPIPVIADIHFDYKQLLWDYLKISTKGQTCHSLSAALGMHQVFINKGDMRLTDWAEFQK